MTGETVFLAVDKCAELPDIQRQTMEIVDGVVSELPGQEQTCHRDIPAWLSQANAAVF